jgi:magnesium transporter
VCLPCLQTQRGYLCQSKEGNLTSVKRTRTKLRMNQNTVVDLLERRDFAALRRSIIGMRPVEVARLLESLPPEDELVAFRLLPKGMAVEVFEQMESDQQRRLLESFTTEGAREIIEEMSPDDRAALMDEVPAMVARRLLQLLSPGQRKVTMTLLDYDEGTAGRVMTPDFVDLRRDMSTAEALVRIRRQSLGPGDDLRVLYY